jgi:hypothetical protein
MSAAQEGLVSFGTLRRATEGAWTCSTLRVPTGIRVKLVCVCDWVRKEACHGPQDKQGKESVSFIHTVLAVAVLASQGVILVRGRDKDFTVADCGLGATAMSLVGNETSFLIRRLVTSTKE